MQIFLNVIIILLIFIGWMFLDYLLGRKRHLSNLNRENFPIHQSNLSLFTSGPELYKDLFTELRKAEHHIHILFYTVKADTISQEFLSILKEKAATGVEVRLLLDSIGSFSVKRKIVKMLRQYGVHCAFCHIPRLPFFFYSSQVRNHRKITIIDGKIGYLGGFNIGKEYINLKPKLSPWRDYHLKIKGEGVDDLQREFLLDWQEAAKINLLENEIYFPKQPKGSIRHQIIPSEGEYLEETFSSLIRKAENEILIGTPYFIPSTRLINDLVHALKRGVHVQILVPKTADHLLVKEASYIYLRTLLKENATIYQYLKGFYHAKILIIDDKICDIGTANFDKRSFFLNHEINCYIYDKAFIEYAKSILKKDMLNAKELHLQELNTPNFWRSMKEWIARPISTFL